MKILIIGSGICGLSTYHFIRKHLPTHAVHIYEAYPKSVRAVGTGLGLAPNGVRVLHAIDPALVTTLLEPTNSFTGETFVMRNSHGSTLARIPLGRGMRYKFPNIMVARSVVYAALEKDLPADAITYQTRVRCVREREDGVEVEFEDGRLETCDLLLAADGVRSAVRPTVVGIGFEAQYHGLTAIGGFMSSDPLPQYIKDSLKPHPIVMTFGRDGFFGYAPYCTVPSPRIMWWSTYSSPTPPPRDLPVDTIKTQLLTRHADWVDPQGEHTYRELIEHATSSTEEMMVLPTWITPPLPRYAVSSGRVVLLGDAAHAMPPDSGQGASLALEDAQTIVLLLKHFLGEKKGDGEALVSVAQAFEALRMGRADYILAEAKKRGDGKRPLTWYQEKIRDWVVWIVGFFPEHVHDWKLGYDVEVEIGKHLAARQ